MGLRVASDSSERVLHVKELLGRGQVDAVLDELAAAVENGEDSASWIVLQLGKQRYAGAAPAVAAILRQHPKPHLRRRAARVLGMLGAADGSEALVAALRDPDVHTACWAADSLARLAAVEAKPALVATLDRPEQSVRRAAAAALAELDASDAINALVAAREGSNWITRRAIARSVRAIRRR